MWRPVGGTPNQNAHVECRTGIGPPQGTAPASGLWLHRRCGPRLGVLVVLLGGGDVGEFGRGELAGGTGTELVGRDVQKFL